MHEGDVNYRSGVFHTNGVNRISISIFRFLAWRKGGFYRFVAIEEWII
jgi:hypothetical protein